MQQFNTRNYSIRDFEEWQERGELVLAPKFQRREVWNEKAKSFLIDTIVRGKPIPKLYMRQDVNSKTRRTTREIVDGQQRLRTALSFVKDGFKLGKTHNEQHGGKLFSELDAETQKEVLKYEFVVDLLQDMPDADVYDLFARINTYSEKLKPQELRNAKYFGEFKSCVYQLSNEYVSFFESKKILSPKQIIRMAEAEFVSELVLALEEGIKEGKKTVLDSAYARYDDNFPQRRRHEKRFRETMDLISVVIGDQLSELALRATRLFYPLFCAFYHLKFGLPRLPSRTNSPVSAKDHAKYANALEQIDNLVRRHEEAQLEATSADFSVEESKFIKAYAQHWVHADNRTTLTLHIYKQLVRSVK